MLVEIQEPLRAEQMEKQLCVGGVPFHKVPDDALFTPVFLV